jgi:hypothetical protein
MTKLTIVVLLAVLAFGIVRFGTAQQQNLTPGSAWKVVSLVQLRNLTGNVNQNIFTPTTTGIFRLTLYGEFLRAATNFVPLCPYITYTNAAGGFNNPLPLAEACTGSEAPAGGDFYWVLPFSAMAGTPVTLKTDQGGTDPTLLYEMNVTIERLETTP